MKPPLPTMDDPLTAPHWAAAAQGRLAMQRCGDCGYVRWPAARACPECLSETGDWVRLSGRGQIWSFAVYPHALHPAFEGECPYAVALVRLDEGPMIYGRIEGDCDALHCEQRVAAVFPEVAPGVCIPRFRPEVTA
jgi:uncharacterized OB-fold protein